MSLFRTAALCCLLALQGQAAICPVDLVQAIDCSSPARSCCSEAEAPAVCPCSSGQSVPFSQGEKESCGGCQMDTHEHPPVWQIQVNERLLPQPTSFFQVLRLNAVPTVRSFNKVAGMLEAPPGPKPRQAHCVWRL
ncbi:MAG: hypothetical protein ACON46_00300 [Coraliomargaritaceae bacterium]